MCFGVGLRKYVHARVCGPHLILPRAFNRIQEVFGRQVKHATFKVAFFCCNSSICHHFIGAVWAFASRVELIVAKVELYLGTRDIHNFLLTYGINFYFVVENFRGSADNESLADTSAMY